MARPRARVLAGKVGMRALAARGPQAGGGMWRGAAVQVVGNANFVGVIMFATLSLGIFFCDCEPILRGTIEQCNC